MLGVLYEGRGERERESDAEDEMLADLPATGLEESEAASVMARRTGERSPVRKLDTERQCGCLALPSDPCVFVCVVQKMMTLFVQPFRFHRFPRFSYEHASRYAIRNSSQCQLKRQHWPQKGWPAKPPATDPGPCKHSCKIGPYHV